MVVAKKRLDIKLQSYSPPMTWIKSLVLKDNLPNFKHTGLAQVYTIVFLDITLLWTRVLLGHSSHDIMCSTVLHSLHTYVQGCNDVVHNCVKNKFFTWLQHDKLTEALRFNGIYTCQTTKHPLAVSILP